MTRPLIAALLLSTALGLTACGGKKDEAKPTKAPAAAGAARAVTVGLIESRPLGAGFEAPASWSRARKPLSARNWAAIASPGFWSRKGPSSGPASRLCNWTTRCCAPRSPSRRP